MYVCMDGMGWDSKRSVDIDVQGVLNVAIDCTGSE